MKPDDSLLLEALRYDSLEMPPNGPLAASKVERFALWIQSGARWPDRAKHIRASTGKITDKDRQWWAFQPLADVAIPADSQIGEAINEIDRFVHQRLAAEGMRPAPKADNATLLRRLYQAVIGLPPSPEQTAAFLNDPSNEAYESLVDSLLADQRYGEHWARFWLDLVRYAETRGHEFDHQVPNAFRYRDYVIRAFNADLPYDQFVNPPG